MCIFHAGSVKRCAHGRWGAYLLGGCAECIERLRWERDLQRAAYQRAIREDPEITAAARLYARQRGLSPTLTREALA